MKLRFGKKQSFYALLFLVLVVALYSYSGSRLLEKTRWPKQFAGLVSVGSFLRNTDLNGKSDGLIGLIFAKFARQPRDGEWTFASKCKCRKHEQVKLVKSGNAVKFTVKSFGKRISDWKSIDLDNYRLNCGLYNAMRRDGNRRIISYSLYGKHELYYRYIKNISLSVKKLYPEWTIRIYHDDTINKTKICELECLREFANDTGGFIDNLDFCDVNQLPLDLFDPSRTWSAGYLHAMKWRWLPVGDSLVDYFMSRDSDSLILEREVDAVNEWIKSNTLLHVMRDNPQHTISILGGLWGLAKRLDEKLASQIYQKLIDSEPKNTPLGHTNPRGVDQGFLDKEIWPMFLKHKNVTVHDSFNCRSYGIISHGFPTKRKGNCFVGQIGECNLTGVLPSKCPLECRPPSHPDWEYC